MAGVEIANSAHYLARQNADIPDEGSAFTVSFWFNGALTGSTGFVCLFNRSVGSGDNEWWGLYDSGGTWYCGIWDTDTGKVSSGDVGPITANTWYHVAAVMETGNTRRFYLDGVDTANGSVTGGSSSFDTIELINSNLLTYYEYLNGTVTAAKAWSAVLTAAEIQQEMNVIRPVRTSNLFAWWPLVNGVSDLVDYSGNGRSLTASNGGAGLNTPISWGSVPMPFGYIAAGGQVALVGTVPGTAATVVNAGLDLYTASGAAYYPGTIVTSKATPPYDDYPWKNAQNVDDDDAAYASVGVD